jgi:hypothetical protein
MMFQASVKGHSRVALRWMAGGPRFPSPVLPARKRDGMRKTTLFILLLLTLLRLAVPGPGRAGEQDAGAMKGIPASVAADYIHSVIQANRAIYSEVIVERLGFAISLKATERWRVEKTLPLPAQFLLLSSQVSEKKNVGMTYRLMSLWPINPRNSPKDDKERLGLEKVVESPDKPYRLTLSTGTGLYHKSIYPDIAVTKACVTCHNQHPKTIKNTFKLGDVMGGIAIKIPVRKDIKDPISDEFLVPPEVVADYIHSVLESDRTVYTEYVVNRLQRENIVYASEHWWEDNALMLPAQFLLNASDLMSAGSLNLDFKLISTWPINPHNGPANEFERKALDQVAKKPFRPYNMVHTIGGKNYFQAVYPDLAVSPACVTCHNHHPKSPKRDFALNDVMGGIVMTFPLNP